METFDSFDHNCWWHLFPFNSLHFLPFRIVNIYVMWLRISKLVMTFSNLFDMVWLSTNNLLKRMPWNNWSKLKRTFLMYSFSGIWYILKEQNILTFSNVYCEEILLFHFFLDAFFLGTLVYGQSCLNPTCFCLLVINIQVKVYG